MKKMDTLVMAVILLTVLFSVCTVADFLALHDINKDYVSQAALQYLAAETSNDLPAWTDTQMEWTTVTVSYLIRSVSIVLSFFILFGLKRELRNFQSN
jgi:hypothetical protein